MAENKYCNLGGLELIKDSYTKINDGFADVETDVTDLQGATSSHANNKNNPHNVTKAQIGLGNVDNTSDMDKPVSTAQAAAIGSVADAISNHINDTGTPHPVIFGYVDNQVATRAPKGPDDPKRYVMQGGLWMRAEMSVIELPISYEPVTYNLETNTAYAVDIYADTTFVLPDVSDTDIHNQIVVYFGMYSSGGSHTINFGTSLHWGPIPNILPGEKYKAEYDYHPSFPGWIVRVTPEGDIGAETPASVVGTIEVKGSLDLNSDVDVQANSHVQVSCQNLTATYLPLSEPVLASLTCGQTSANAAYVIGDLTSVEIAGSGIQSIKFHNLPNVEYLTLMNTYEIINLDVSMMKNLKSLAFVDCLMLGNLTLPDFEDVPSGTGGFSWLWMVDTDLDVDYTSYQTQWQNIVSKLPTRNAASKGTITITNENLKPQLDAALAGKFWDVKTPWS